MPKHKLPAENSLMPSAKGRQVRILIGNHDSCLSDILCHVSRAAIKDQREIAIVVAKTSSHIRALVHRNHYDAVILILNNIVVDDVPVSSNRDRVEKVLDLVGALHIRQMPVFALTGFPDEHEIAAKAISKGARYFSRLPFIPEELIEAIYPVLVHDSIGEPTVVCADTDDGSRGTWIERSANRIFGFWAAFLPARINNEEFGDAMEGVTSRIRQGHRFSIWLYIVRALCWANINACRYAFMKNRRKA